MDSKPKEDVRFPEPLKKFITDSEFLESIGGGNNASFVLFMDAFFRPFHDRIALLTKINDEEILDAITRDTFTRIWDNRLAFFFPKKHLGKFLYHALFYELIEYYETENLNSIVHIDWETGISIREQFVLLTRKDPFMDNSF